jgi:hypothetical protein
VDLIKLDIQGAERAVQGACKLIACSALLCLVTEFWPARLRACGDDPEENLHELSRLRFRIWVIGPGSRPRLVPLEGVALHLQAQRGHEVNLFCRKA